MEAREVQSVLITEIGGRYHYTPADGKIPTLEELQNAVMGNIEVLHLKDGSLLVVNEEGRLKGMTENPEATSLARIGEVIPLSGHIVGPVVHFTFKES